MVTAVQILFDKNAMSALRSQREESSNGFDAPLRWHLFLDEFATGYTGNEIREHENFDFLKSGRLLLTWHPSVTALFQGFLGNVAYLCWGVGASSQLRQIFMASLFREAAHLLVNESTSEEEVIALSGRRPHMVPMFIDCGYFGYKNSSRRKDFLFCNGSNGRDPNILVRLAHAGHHVTWLCNDEAMIERYGTSHSNLRIVSRISYSELCNLYQTCKAAIMPSIENIHAAGQTTGLEALACGAPLIASAGRSAAIFGELKSVAILRSNSVSSWLESIDNVEELSKHTQGSSNWVKKHCDKDNVMQALRTVLLG